jgi:D-arginine dehydrogenase
MDVAIAVDRAEQLADLKIRNVRQRWAGLRTFAPDRVPVIGFDRDPGFFWLAGQGGYGVQTAPALADLAARMIAAGASPRAELDPLRFR